MSTEWRRVIGGLILAVGFLTAITLALLVTHPCGPPFFEGELALYDECGAVVPALVVSGVSLALGVPLAISGMKPRGKWLVVALVGLCIFTLALGVGVLRVLSTALLCSVPDDCGTRGFLPGGEWILILGGSLLAAGGAGYTLARRRETRARRTDSRLLAENNVVT